MRLRFFLALACFSLFIIPLFAQEEVELISAGTYTGEITTENTVVRYNFEAIAGQQVTITMEAADGSELDPTLNLYDTNGVLLQTDDDSGGNRNAQIIFIPQINGIFMIEARRYEVTSPFTVGAYRLTLSIADSQETTLDPLSIPPDFGVPFEDLALDDTFPASFTTGDDLQYYVIGAEQGDFIRVELTTNENLDASVRVLTRINQTLTEISRTVQNTSTAQIIFATIPQTGWYLIEVMRERGVGGYNLTPTLVSDTLLSADTPTQASFDGETDTLLFVFNGTINERVFVNLTVLEGNNLEPEITILDLSQNQLEQRSSQGVQVRANLSVPRSSPYIVQVRNLGVGTGTFELQLRRIPVDINKLTIRPASYNDRLLGFIRDTTPIEYYRFSGKAGELVTLEMNSLVDSSLLDPYLILADSNLNELVFNDNASASRSARISQYALPADGDYFILATRAGLSRGSTQGAYELRITVGEIQLDIGQLSATLTWEGTADLNLYMSTPTGYTISWANPTTPEGGRLQIDSNTGCETPTAQPVEHIVWDDDEVLPDGDRDYTIWVWYQQSCMMSGDTPFTLSIYYRGEVLLTRTSSELERISLDASERYEVSIRVTDSGNAFVVNRGSYSTPSAQQTESQGGDTLIVYGEPISGSITDEVFARFYQFEGNAGDTVVITVERITNNLDPMLILRNSLDDNLAMNDDIGEGNRNAQIIHTLDDSGRYVIAVTRYGVRDGTTTGNYTLSVNLLDESDDSSE